MKQILIVEDDQSIARLEKDYLEINGFEVIHEATGDITSIMSVVEKCDLIILDLMLPKGNGFDICKKIRETYDKPILIVSAKDEDMDIVLGLGFGANDYIKKPFSPSELIARVKAHLKNYDLLRIASSTNKVKKIEIRGLLLDGDAKRVYINGKEIELTKKEFEILMLLSSNRNKVFSKEEIYNRLWDQDALGYYDTISVHIRRIREKIEEDPKHAMYIETIWGVGYRIK